MFPKACEMAWLNRKLPECHDKFVHESPRSNPSCCGTGRRPMMLPKVSATFAPAMTSRLIRLRASRLPKDVRADYQEAAELDVGFEVRVCRIAMVVGYASVGANQEAGEEF